jgi:hypothetical protein
MVEEEAVDHPIPDVPVSITILVVSVAVVFTGWVPVISCQWFDVVGHSIHHSEWFERASI